MALRDQPYIPLYVKDFLTDEKLIECSPEAHGVYIRTMCIMHKSERYGTILLKQKDKQSDKQILNFANKLDKFLPWNLQVIHNALEELLTENVLQIEGDFLIQKRMEKDGKLSDIRALAGKKGGNKTLGKKQNFAQAKNQANTAIEYVNENEDENVIENNNKSGRKFFSIPSVEEISAYCQERKNSVNPQTFFDFYQSKGWKIGKNQMKDWKACVRTWEKNSTSNNNSNGKPEQTTTGKQQYKFSSAEAIKTFTGNS